MNAGWIASVRCSNFTKGEAGSGFRSKMGTRSKKALSGALQLPERGLKRIYGSGHGRTRPGQSPSSAPGRRCNQSVIMASISGSVAVACWRRSRWRIIASPRSNKASVKPKRRMTRSWS